LVEKRGLKELERRVALVLAQSFSNIKFLEWTATKPEAASLKIEVDQDNSILVFLGYKGSALLSLDGEPFWSLDGYHKSVQVKKGRHEIGAEFTPYLAFGEKTQIHHGTPILALCDPVAYKLWIHCSMALELAKQTKDKEVASDLLDALTSSLEHAYFEAVTHEQLVLAGYLVEKFPKELVNTIPETSAVLKELGYREAATPGKWQEALSDLEERLHVLVEKYGKRGRILGIGHGHIDTAWLWPFTETEKKVARTFSVVSTLLDREPEFHYIQSMAL